MESLLSLAFDNITTKDTLKIRKGLKQIEGLLAQICLSGNSNNLSPVKRRSSVVPQGTPADRKGLKELTCDPAFREFFRLQEGFEWNVGMRLVGVLERLLGCGSSDEIDLLIVQTLDLLQGILLLHPPTRTLFGREIYMNLLLDLLDPFNPSPIQTATLHVLVSSLLSTPSNTRVFEDIDGLLTVTSLLKNSTTSQTVKTKLLELLYFYLLAETPARDFSTAPGLGKAGNRSPSKLGAGVGGVWERRTLGERERERDRDREEGNGDGDAEAQGMGLGNTKTSEEKQRLLRRYLGETSVEEMVKDLREASPFEGPRGERLRG